jgi:hypothetical protein
MVTQLFQSVTNKDFLTTLPSGTSNIIALPIPVDRSTSNGTPPPALPKSNKVIVPIHQYKGGYRETFIVEGSPYGDHWLSETTASVETEAVKVLAFLKAQNPTGILCLFVSLLPLLCLWFAV